MESSNSETVPETIDTSEIFGFSLFSLSAVDIIILISSIAFLLIFLYSRRKPKPEEENVSANFTLL